jgi:hypothetical protein
MGLVRPAMASKRLNEGWKMLALARLKSKRGGKPEKGLPLSWNSLE